MSQEIYNSVLLEAINTFSERVDQRLDRIETTMATKGQINILVDVLHANSVISKYEAAQVKNISA